MITLGDAGCRGRWEILCTLFYNSSGNLQLFQNKRFIFILSYWKDDSKERERSKTGRKPGPVLDLGGRFEQRSTFVDVMVGSSRPFPGRDISEALIIG